MPRAAASRPASPRRARIATARTHKTNPTTPAPAGKSNTDGSDPPVPANSPAREARRYHSHGVIPAATNDANIPPSTDPAASATSRQRQAPAGVAYPAKK